MESKDHSSKKPSSLPFDKAKVERVRQLFDEWLQDSSGYDEQTWPELKKSLNENHSSTHNLFDE